jgi:hypothetical protein
MNIPNLSIVIVSCWKYRDTWEPLSETFKRYWADCEYKKFLITDKCDPKLSTCFNYIEVAGDYDWSTQLAVAITKINDDNILLLLDDFFLRTKVNSRKLFEIYNEFVGDNLDYLRIIKRPRPDIKIKNRIYGKSYLNHSYAVNTQPALWKKNVLSKILCNGESIWEFERNARLRFQQLGYTAHATNHNYLPTVGLFAPHVIIRGEWILTEYYLFKYKKILVSCSMRKKLALNKTLFLVGLKWFNDILEILPPRYSRKIREKIKSALKVRKIKKFAHNLGIG